MLLCASNFGTTKIECSLEHLAVRVPSILLAMVAFDSLSFDNNFKGVWGESKKEQSLGDGILEPMQIQCGYSSIHVLNNCYYFFKFSMYVTMFFCHKWSHLQP